MKPGCQYVFQTFQLDCDEGTGIVNSGVVGSSTPVKTSKRNSHNRQEGSLELRKNLKSVKAMLIELKMFRIATWNEVVAWFQRN